MPNKDNIFQRINAVMKDVDYVRKDKQVSGGGSNYTAVTHDQVIAHVRDSLVKHGIVIYPEQLRDNIIQKRDVERGIKMMLYTADYAIHFCNIDDPEDRISITVTAHASDNGDKAPPKCLTQATKMAILKVFALETGDDEESRLEDSKTISDTQLGDIGEVFAKLPPERQKKFLQAYKIAGLEEMPRKQFAKAFKQLQDAVKEPEPAPKKAAPKKATAKKAAPAASGEAE